ncbi:asparagine synthase (glutamine-hydrolyzing) [Tautonia plasticadhaerens]|uniref:asparagine synthase (glutamine-hydrolyzing) n=1 Tax=Tautonia plasticadhaerens TaxID=2527974 RepID=A0A518GUJ5_9BACT|nr:asparagine synthase (glutamine-hydrolyzing) [Tautonia plasticadhaerens]QDV32244.1 Asparagine synthetase [glutamine-hydrolyzing] 1 [Tautonia plasticadhaerens]
MCGICGAAWGDHGSGPTAGQLDAMIARLEHRGPDDLGSYRDHHAALGFRRLSILDLPGGHQPMGNEDGSVRVVFNGEIYNFPSLRNRLEARGHTLRSAGDTEVISHLYEDEGPGFSRHLRGMFTVAVWDAPRRRLVLARDRLGQKPLVYRLESDRILFASELKALLALPGSELPRELDPLAVDRYLTYGYVPHPRTILRGVYKLPPAHYAVWHEGSLELRRYWEPDWDLEVRRPVAEDEERLRATLDDAVREQMAADVPLGAFLSGGVDSTIIVGLMQKHSHNRVKTFSIGFDDPAFDESGYARMAAEHLGTEHHAFVVKPDAWETLPGLARHFDEPFADSSALPTWHVSRLTRQHVTVALTGDAGDELFGGYDRYRAVALAEAVARLPGGVGRWLGGPVARAVPGSSRAKTRLRSARRWLEAVGLPPGDRYLRWMTSFDEQARAALYSDEFLDTLAEAGSIDPEDADPAGVLHRALGVAPGRDPVTRAMIADVLTYLPGDLLVKVDLASMAHGLECRGPFLDDRVVELALAMPLDRKLRLRKGRSKVILKRAFADLLPPPIRTRPKMGFGVPIDRWFRGELKDELRSVLLDPVSLSRGLFRPEAVGAMVAEHVEGRRDHAYRLWALLMLELWFRHHVDPSPSATASADLAAGRPIA